jgi:hypothetical protein
MDNLVWPSIAGAPFTGSHVLAKANMALLNLFRASGLGPALVASMGDPLNAASLRTFFTNRSIASGMASMADSVKYAVAAVAKGIGREEQHVMAMMHTAAEGMLHYMIADGAPMSGAVRATAGLSQAVYNIGFVQRWWNGIRFGSVLATGKDFGMAAGQAFDKLMPGQQAHLRQFGITPEEWDVIRKAPLMDYRGSGMLTAEAVAGMDPEAFRALHPKSGTATEGQLKRIREDVSAKFSNLAHVTAEMAVATPTRIMQAAYIKPGSQGTIGGAAMAHFRLFRGFADALFGHHTAREMMGYHAERPKNLPELFMRIFTDPKAGQLSGIIGLMTGITAAEWLRRRYNDGKFPVTAEEAGGQIAEAFLGSGAFGFQASLLEPLWSRAVSGRSLESSLKNMMGLSMNHADNLFTTGQDLLQIAMAEDSYERDKKARKLGRDAFKSAYALVPFRNLWYTKWATDYMIRDNLNRWIDPEYQARMDMAKEREEYKRRAGY